MALLLISQYYGRHGGREVWCGVAHAAGDIDVVAALKFCCPSPVQLS
jgi:hypothetical protein